MKRWMTCVAAMVVLAAMATPARAAFHVYRLAEIFSSSDGSVQFIRLHCPAGANFQSFWTGQSLTCTDGTTTHTLVFPSDLPSTATSNTDVLVATANFGSLPGGVTPNFVIPAGFLFTTGGTVTFSPGSSIPTFVYGPLPTDGQTSLNATGALGVNTPRNFAGASGSVNVPPGTCCVGAACTITVQVSCSGSWTSGGSCASNPCAPPAGVCCAGSTCRVDTTANCAGVNTLFNPSPACNGAGNNASPCCRADFNHINGISVQDIFDFLGLWFAGSTTTDFDGNGAGTPTVQSIFSFLNAWFTGC